MVNIVEKYQIIVKGDTDQDITGDDYIGCDCGCSNESEMLDVEDFDGEFLFAPLKSS